MNQKGIAPLLILIPIAVIAVIAVIAFGFYSASSKSQPSPSITPTLTVQEPQAPLGTPGCPELDYTGCDTSGEFMTWQDDNIR